METPPSKRPLPKFLKPGGVPVPGPGLTLSFKKPQFKKSGLPIFSPLPAAENPTSTPFFQAASAGRGGLLGKLRGLKPHELAFVAAGVGIIVLAPLAEYLVSNTGDSSPALKGGFAGRGTGPVFPEAASPFEGGLGIAQGDLVGAAKDIVTPMGGAKDPLSMILKLAGAESAPTSEIPPAEKKEEKKEEPPASSSSWKDAITAAKTAVTSAVKKTPGIPRPTEKLTGALKGLSSGSGPGSTSGPSSVTSSAMTPIRLEPPSSRGLVGSPRQDSALTRVRPAAGFRGGGSRGMNAGGGGAAGGQRAGGPSIAGPGGFLQETLSAGPGGGGRASGETGPSSGGGTANPSGNVSRDQRTTTTTPQENLALLRQKMEMEKSIALKYDKKRYDQLDRKKMLEQIAAQTLAQTAQQAFLKILDKILGNNNKDKQNNQQQQQNPAAAAAQQQAPNIAAPNNVAGRPAPLSVGDIRDRLNLGTSINDAQLAQLVSTLGVNRANPAIGVLVTINGATVNGVGTADPNGAVLSAGSTADPRLVLSGSGGTVIGYVIPSSTAGSLPSLQTQSGQPLGYIGAPVTVGGRSLIPVYSNQTTTAGSYGDPRGYIVPGGVPLGAGSPGVTTRFIGADGRTPVPGLTPLPAPVTPEVI